MQDGAPAHKAKSVRQFPEENNIPTLEWPGNSPDLNPIENAWNVIKNELGKSRPSRIDELRETLKRLWVNMDRSYFVNLANSMLRRLQMVIDNHGNMTKY